MKVAIIGYGKMGREIEQILLGRGHEVALKIDLDNRADLNAERLKGIDIAIEFTTPQTAYDNIRTCLEAGVAIVSGTTGWTERLGELRALCDELKGCFMYASNYSLGVNIAFRVNRYLASLMSRVEGYDVRIEEVHHTQKKDAPSGTAITLAEQIIEQLPSKQSWHCIEPQKGEVEQHKDDSIEITSLREGSVPGIHTVTYESNEDTLTLHHSLTSRTALAKGVVAAAEFVCGKHGNFSMDDLFKTE